MKPGDRVITIRSHSKSLDISPLLLRKPLTIGDSEKMAHYLSMHRSLSEILEGSGVELVLDSGNVVRVPKIKSPQISLIPAIFWSFLFTNTLGLLVGLLVWVSRSSSLETHLLFMAGIGFFLQGVFSSVLMARELTLSFPLFQFLMVSEGFFLVLFASSMIAILVSYPVRLFGKSMLVAIFAVSFAVWFNRFFPVIELPPHILISQYIIDYLAAIAVMWIQWINSRNKPIERATVLWFLGSILFPVSIVLILFVIPVVFGSQPVLGSIYPRLLVWVIYLGWALGIIKYRLFDVEYWWSIIWTWLMLGFVVVITGVTLLNIFHFREIYSLLTAVAITLFLYLPVMQRFPLEFSSLQEKTLSEYFPEFIKLMTSADSHQQFEQKWNLALKRLFQPQEIRLLNNKRSLPAIFDKGLSVDCPGLAPETAYRLIGKNKGASLFNRRDLMIMSSLHSMAKLTSDSCSAREHVVYQERKRVMTDLHDSLGADLITLLHSSDSPRNREYAKRALQTLRDTVKISVSEEPGFLTAHVAQWRSEAVERMEISNVSLDWKTVDIRPDTILPVDTAIKLTSCLRESINNALKHAHPRTIAIEIRQSDDALMIKVCNDGQIGNSSEWASGVGLAGIRSRINSLDGQFSIDSDEIHVCLTIEICLSHRDEFTKVS